MIFAPLCWFIPDKYKDLWKDRGGTKMDHVLSLHEFVKILSNNRDSTRSMSRRGKSAILRED